MAWTEAGLGQQSGLEKELESIWHGWKLEQGTQCREPGLGDFLGGSVVKTLPSNARGKGSVPGRELRSHNPQGQRKETIEQKQYCNKFKKDFKNGPHPTTTKKKVLKKKKIPAWSRGFEGLEGCEEFPEKATWTLP